MIETLFWGGLIAGGGVISYCTYLYFREKYYMSKSKQASNNFFEKVLEPVHDANPDLSSINIYFGGDIASVIFNDSMIGYFDEASWVGLTEKEIIKDLQRLWDEVKIEGTERFNNWIKGKENEDDGQP